MKKFLALNLVLLLTAFSTMSAFSFSISVNADDDISDYFDLELLATQFAKSRTLNEFERRVNDPGHRISNLDLNNDGYVDFIRVIKQTTINDDMIILQAVLGNDYYQDVATIYIDRNKYKEDYILIVGDPYLFGEGYWLEPDFYYTPRLIKWLWRNAHYNYFSPYRWDYYPDYFFYSHILPYNVYWNNVRNWIDYSHHYRYIHTPRIQFNLHFDRSYNRNDMFKYHPNKRFEDRNREYRNKKERSDNYRREKNQSMNNDRPASKDRNSEPVRIQTRDSGEPSRTVRDNKVETRTSPVRERNVETRPIPTRKPNVEVKSNQNQDRKVESRQSQSRERNVESKPVPTRERKTETKPVQTKEKKVEAKPSVSREKKPDNVKPTREKETKD